MTAKPDNAKKVTDALLDLTIEMENAGRADLIKCVKRAAALLKAQAECIEQLQVAIALKMRSQRREATSAALAKLEAIQ